MTPFSWQKAKLNAIDKKIKIAKKKLKSNPDYKNKHTAEARDASKGQYTLMIKRITDETTLNQERNMRFREKLHGTN